MSKGTMTRLEALTLLDEYHNSHEEGDRKVKSTYWNLTKARQSRGGGVTKLSLMIAASDVREDLVARTVLKEEGKMCNGELPTLTDEGKSSKKSSSAANNVAPTPVFAVVDAVEERHMEKENGAKAQPPAASSKDGDESSNNSTGGLGLRNRKSGNAVSKAAAEASSSSSWEVELEGTDAAAAEEEKFDETGEGRLQAADPINLLGGAFPPRELKKAQQEAKAALESYVKAANLSRLILSKLESQ